MGNSVLLNKNDKEQGQHQHLVTCVFYSAVCC